MNHMFIYITNYIYSYVHNYLILNIYVEKYCFVPILLVTELDYKSTFIPLLINLIDY